MKRFFLISLTTLAALLLVTVGTIFWLLHDQVWIKGQVQQFVTELTGRQFLIEGPLDIALSAHPVVEAHGLSLANASWADPAEMVRLEKLRFSFDFPSIFSEQLGIHFVEVEGLAVALAENDAGEVNWDLFPGAEQEPEAPPSQLPYRVGRVTVTDFSLSHEAPNRKEPLNFSLAELIAVRMENEQIDASARGSLDGTPLELDGYLGPLNHLLLGGKLDGKLDLIVGDIQLNFQGHVEDSLTFDGIDIAINFSGPEFTWVTHKLALPDFSSGEFDFDLLLDSTELKTQIDVVGNLGSLDVNVTGEADDLFDITEGQMDFEVTGPDLQALGKAFGEPNLMAETYHLKGDLSTRHAVTQVHNLTLEIGESQGRVSGRIGKWPQLIDSEFDIWLKGPDISVWGPLVRLENLSPLEYELSGRFSNKDSNVILTTTRLDVGETFIELAGSLGQLPGLVGAGLDVIAMSPDLGKITVLPDLAGFPTVPVTIKGNLGRNEQFIFFNKLNIGLGGDSLVVDGAIPIDDYSQGSEVETRAEIRSLGALGELFGYKGLPDYPLRLQADARLAGGGLEFAVKESSLGELAIDLQGSLADMRDIKSSSVQFQLSIPSISDLPYEMDEMELPAIPATVKGRFDYQDEFIVLSGVDGRIGETIFNFDTTLSQAAGLAGSKLAFTVSGPDFRALIPLESLQQLPGRFKASGRIVRGSGTDRIEALELELGALKAKMDGTVDDLMNISSAEMTVSASGPDLSMFSGFLERDVPADPFKLETSIKGSDRYFEADSIQLTWGPSDLAGNFTLGLKDRVVFNGSFHSDLLSIAWLTAPQDEQDPEEESTKEKGDLIFPDTPIPENRFGDLDLDLEFHARQIITDATELYGVDLELVLRDRLIQLEANIAGGPWGEKVSGKYTFDTKGDDAKLDLSLDGDGFRIDAMAPEGHGPESTPPTNFMIRVAGHGATWHQLASSFNGRFRLHQDAGLISNAGMDLIFSDLLTELLNTLNPFAQTKPYTELECSLMAADIKDGQVTVDPVIYQTKEIIIVSGGTIDLVSEKLILDFHTQVRKGIGISAGMVVNPFIRLGGKLISPAIEIDPAGAAVKGTVAVATVGLSVLARGLYDRFLSGKDPCGKALKKLLEADAEEQ